MKFSGGLTALAGAAGIVLAVYLKLYPNAGVALPSAIHTAIYGVSVLVSGMVLYCLGAIVDHLKAIRDFQRRQIEIFERMGKNRAAPASGPARVPEPASRIVREEARPATDRDQKPRQDDQDQGDLLVKRAS